MGGLITFSGKTDVGRRRSHNEDAFVLGYDLGFAALADGMGGVAAGEVASQIFVETALEVLSRKSSSEQEAFELVRKAFHLAHSRILDRAGTDPHCRGMGCTSELLVFFQRQYVIGHVGDSRTYLFRKGRLLQITKDHSLVQEHVDRGLITAAEARTHSRRNIILKAVGVDEKPAVDLLSGEIMHDDCFLLCSDGLTDMVEDGAIEDVLSSALDISQRAEGLIDLARAAGGHDNITVVLCEVKQDG